jgi:hypothetical protein
MGFGLQLPKIPLNASILRGSIHAALSSGVNDPGAGRNALRVLQSIEGSVRLLSDETAWLVQSSAFNKDGSAESR